MSDQQPQTVVNVNTTLGASGGAAPGAKSVGVAVVLCLFLGWFGAHRFYLQRPHAATMVIVNVAGWVLALMGAVLLFGVGAVIGWLAWGPLLVWIIIDLFSVAAWVQGYHGQPAAVAAPQNPQALLLQAAQQRNGRLTIAGAAAATGMSLSDVENALTEMEVNGHVERVYEPESTVPVYVFGGLS